MSNPNEVPPQQPGAQPPPSDNVPPAGPDQPPATPASPPGYQAPPPGYQPPPEYQGQPGYQAPPPGYQTPGYPGQSAPAGGSRFAMPTDRPRNFSDALPAGGLSGMFKVTAMPTELKISYWIWVIGGFLGLLGGIIGLFGSFVLIAFAPAIGLLVLLLVLVAFALATAQIILAMKMKEGREWARLALTILAGLSLLLALISAGVVEGRGGGSVPGFIISLVATVLMWLPNSQAWFAAQRGRI
ncbi:hypothetical protein [Arthrobacter sp. NicSoilB8]|uniref:hypothetical protein n=1 Tax=Arthrobacter sp. NicSoilB8 TaxID=2830998 RepID=UPI001CC52CC5|nr:hypothetical protein [Arthrobacter sp. NicSoilB8]BCW72646.1 hypothetical protein NicSoilB8_36900 [Arthrobacter sp. NicSoilB8]